MRASWWSRWWRRRRKALVAAAVALAVVAGVPDALGLDADTWNAVLILLGAAGVYAVPNESARVRATDARRRALGRVSKGTTR